MSTAGKVLVVLTTLVVLVSVVLASAVTQVNRAYVKKTDDLERQYPEIEKQIVETRAAIRRTAQQAFNARTEGQAEVARLEAALALAARDLSLTRESTERVRLLAEQLNKEGDKAATLQRTVAEKEQRLAEREAETKAKADALAEVKRLHDENDQLISQLNSLREKFTTTLRTNKEMADRVLRESQRTRPASLTSPAAP